MAFWGVEVRPGRPFTHSYNQERGRLHISQATLGIGASAKKCLLKCNVGYESPVLLCALLPEKTEYCRLDLEFEEADDVIFSVIGTRSVHLTGYFLGKSRPSNVDDSTESYGEDIGNTDSEKSTDSSKEDEYVDSFIDDSEPEVSPASPLSDGRESDLETLDKKKSEGKKGTRKRLKKKYQPVESEDNNSLQQNIANHRTVVPRVESEDEDNLPTPSMCKPVTPDAGGNIAMEIGEMSNKKSEDGYHPTSTPNSEANVADGSVGRDMALPCKSMLPPAAIGPENGLELKEEIANRPTEEKTLETYIVTNCDAIDEDKLPHTEEKRGNEDLLGKNGDDQKSANDKDVDLPYSSMLRSDGISPEMCLTLNKEKEEVQHAEEKTDNGYLLNKNGQDQESTNDKESDPSHLSLRSADDVSLDIHKKSKKREQRAKEGTTEEDLKDNGTLQDKAVNENPSNMKITVQLYDPLLSSTDAGSDKGVKLKKSREDSAAHGKSFEGNTSNNRSPEEDSVKENEGGAGETVKDLDEKSETDQKSFHNKGVNLDPDLVGGNLDSNISSLPGKEERSLVGVEDKNVEDKSSQSRTLPSGLIIEDLQMGKSDGKTSAPGKKNITNHCTVVPRVKSEDEDNLPVLSMCKPVAPEAGGNIDMEIGETNKKKSEGGYNHTSTPSSEANVADGGIGRDMALPCNSMLHPDASGPENGLELKEEIANRPTEEKTLETYSVTGCVAINEDKLQHTEEKRDIEDLLGKNGDDQNSANDNPEVCLALSKEKEEVQHTEEKTDNRYLLVKNGQDQKSTNDKESDPSHLSLHSADDVSLDIHKKSKKRKQRAKEGKTEEDLKDNGTLQDKAVNENPSNMKITVQLNDALLSSTGAGSDNGVKPKKSRKESAAYGKSLEGNTSNNRIPEEDSVKQNEGGAGKTVKDLDEKSKTDQKSSHNKGVNLDPDQVGDGHQYESKKSRKKKNSKLHEIEGNLDTDISSLPGKEDKSVVGPEDKNVEDKSSQSRTLPSGLIIEDLQMGKSDGKIAAPGKKIKVHFVGKIRVNGLVFDSNIGKKPFRFRLGAEDIIDGWNVGIEGMRAGGKRRLIIPPSLGYGSEGAGEAVPPNSWLEYEVELVAVR